MKLDAFGGQSISSAGPYYVADYNNGEYVILKRNPNYHGPRPHALDAIAIREGVDASLALRRVQQEGWDGITSLADPTLNPGGPIDQQWGAGSSNAAKGDQRYFAVPNGTWGNYLLFNAGRPLFSHRNVREAVAYALDRPSLAQAEGDDPLNGGGYLPTDQLLPPHLQDAGSHPSAGPDIAKAKALMHGMTGTAVIVASAGNAAQEAGSQQVKAMLDQIGIKVRVVTVDQSAAAIQEPNAPYDLKLGGDYAGVDPTSRLRALFVGDQPDLPIGWQPSAIRGAVRQLDDASTESEVLAIFAGSIQPEVPMTGTEYSVTGEFLTPRVGCRVFVPASFGVDLAALCLAN